MGLEPPAHPDVRLDVLRRIERQLAAQDRPDVELIALVRGLIVEAQDARDR